jgi:hypothetical protein
MHYDDLFTPKLVLLDADYFLQVEILTELLTKELWAKYMDDDEVEGKDP